MTAWVIVADAGLVAGVLVGRWWAIAAPAGLGLWIATVSEVDGAPESFLGIAYALLGAAGVIAGVLLRRSAARS